eukprot:870611-Rhodomonas_salina.1
MLHYPGDRVPPRVRSTSTVPSTRPGYPGTWVSGYPHCQSQADVRMCPPAGNFKLKLKLSYAGG